MNKLPVFDWFWSQGDVLISVNTKYPQVDIPVYLNNQDIVDFTLGENPTPRLQADDKGILTGMKFGGTPYTCFFPWDSVVKMQCDTSVIHFHQQAQATEEENEPQPEPAKKKRPNLRRIK